MLSPVEPKIEFSHAMVLIILGFGLGSVALAMLYNYMRRRFFSDADTLDQSFDAGGKVSMSLTAVTVAVQLLWPADLLQSATVTTKYGISGGFWYSISIIVNIMLFPLLSMQFKTRAPGAKTFLQLFKARYGKRTHILYCVFALFTNVVVTATLVVAGKSLYQAIVKDISDEMVVIAMAALFGSYSFVGGLGSTFYVSYFNAVLTLSVLSYFVAKIFYMPQDELPFGNFTEIHDKVSKLMGPADNEDRSYVTFWSVGSMVWAAQGTFICIAILFCDQASWQSKIAAKPMQGALGFFFAALIWFAIPSTLGTSAGLAYLSYTNSNSSNISSFTPAFSNSNVVDYIIQGNYVENLSNSVELSSVIGDASKSMIILSANDIDSGLVTPLVADLALGYSGGVVLLVMFTMLMMSTGSGEIMAVASIIVYDIYQSYIQPFRREVKQGHCILCGRPELGEKTEATCIDDANFSCCCPSVSDCSHCAKEMEIISSKKEEDTVVYSVYSCPYHGQYRAYQDNLLELRNWVVLWVTISIIPLGLVVSMSGINLNWIYMNGAMVIVQSFPGIVLSIVWVKTTSKGLIAGSLTGLVSGITASLARASTLEGGLGNFLENTADGYSVLAGSATCTFVSLLVTVIVSLATHTIRSSEDSDREWQKLRDIDNPLRPWHLALKEDCIKTSRLRRRPTYAELNTHYRLAKTTTYIGAGTTIALFLIVIPGCMLTLHTMTSTELQSWLMTLHGWCFVTSLIVIVLTPVEEIKAIYDKVKQDRLDTSSYTTGDDNGENDEAGENGYDDCYEQGIRLIGITRRNEAENGIQDGIGTEVGYVIGFNYPDAEHQRLSVV